MIMSKTSTEDEDEIGKQNYDDGEENDENEGSGGGDGGDGDDGVDGADDGDGRDGHDAGDGTGGRDNTRQLRQPQRRRRLTDCAGWLLLLLHRVPVVCHGCCLLQLLLELSLFVHALVDSPADGTYRLGTPHKSRQSHPLSQVYGTQRSASSCALVQGSRV